MQAQIIAAGIVVHDPRRAGCWVGQPLSPPVSPTGAAVTSSIAYFFAASAAAVARTAPQRASWRSAATTIDSASTWKCRRSACRVSDRPNPSVPSEVYVAGHPAGDQVGHGPHEVADGDHRTAGRRRSALVTYGTRGLLVRVQQVVLLGGHRVAAQLRPRRRRPDVGGDAPLLGRAAAAPSAPTACRCRRRGSAARGPVGRVAFEYRYRPLSRPSTSRSAGSAGWWIGSL